MHLGRLLEQTLRRDGARLRAGLIRRAGDFDRAEDALQEACVRALARWPVDGLPDNPAAWLTTVAQRVLEDARRRREVPLPDDFDAPAVEPGVEEDDPSGIGDDRLRLLFTCCHPALAVEAQMALALRTLGGLSTREIARAFLVGGDAVAQRLVRAKGKIRAARIPYAVPAADTLPERLAGVLGTVYLIFNEGYAATAHEGLLRSDLCREAIRLARLCADLMPAEPEALGLLALLQLTDARRPARLNAAGELVPLPEQDRRLWLQAGIVEGQQALDRALALQRPGPYQLQAAIAALHAEAADEASTDWMQIHALYRRLLQFTPTPVVALNTAVARGMALGPQAALDDLAALDAGGALAGFHLLPASQADFLRRLGRHAEAAEAYRRALALVGNPVERRYLQRRLHACLAAAEHAV